MHSNKQSDPNGRSLSYPNPCTLNANAHLTYPVRLYYSQLICKSHIPNNQTPFSVHIPFPNIGQYSFPVFKNPEIHSPYILSQFFQSPVLSLNKITISIHSTTIVHHVCLILPSSSTSSALLPRWGCCGSTLLIPC